MQTPALFQKAKASQAPEKAGEAPESGGFKRPDVKPLIPANLRDPVDRIVAAGMRHLYSPQMREQVMQAIQSDQPVPQKLGGNVAGLILTLDNQAQGGLPVDAMFPAGVELAGEAADVMAKAGQPVSQEDFNTSLLVLMAILGKKLGANDEQIAQAMQGGGQPSPQERQPGEEPMDDEMPEDVA